MHCLLVNPWIYDFAAFDLWQKPLGLLYMGAVMRDHGWTIELLDCLDRYNPEILPLNKPQNKKFYTGKYLKYTLNKPSTLAYIPRRYGRYGLPENVVRHTLQTIKTPDIIFFTSGMTYWYPALIDLITITREYYPKTPIVLGGIYATVAPEHARKNIPADIFTAGESENRLAEFLPADMLKNREIKTYNSLDDLPYPALDLYEQVNYLPLLTSRGCPLRCSFCASFKVSGKFRQRSVDSVIDEILYSVRRFNVQDVVFYDDALLFNKEEHILPILDTIIELRLPLRFHTPNGLQVGAFDELTVQKMVQSGFKTIRLSLESVSEKRQKNMSSKVSPDSFCNVVEWFEAAGFPRSEVEAYVMMGLPEQEVTEVLDTLFFTAESGVITRLSEFSPIPGTKDWEWLIQSGYIDEDIDLIETNNSIYIHRFPEYSIDVVNAIKNLVYNLNNCVRLNQPLPHKGKAINEIVTLQTEQLKNVI